MVRKLLMATETLDYRYDLHEKKMVYCKRFNFRAKLRKKTSYLPVLAAFIFFYKRQTKKCLKNKAECLHGCLQQHVRPLVTHYGGRLSTKVTCGICDRY